MGEVLMGFQLLLETVLKFVSHVTRVANKSSMKPTAKFWKALQHKCHDMLDKVRICIILKKMHRMDIRSCIMWQKAQFNIVWIYFIVMVGFLKYLMTSNSLFY